MQPVRRVGILVLLCAAMLLAPTAVAIPGLQDMVRAVREDVQECAEGTECEPDDSTACATDIECLRPDESICTDDHEPYVSTQCSP